MSIYKSSSLAMIPTAYKDGKLYSIRPTDGSGDFTFSRGSNLAATRVDVNGLIEKGRENLLLQSNQFDTTWSGGGLTKTSGQSGYDESNDAWLIENVSSGSRFLTQTGLGSGVATFSIYAKAGTTDWILLNNGLGGYSYFDLNNGIIGASTAIDSQINAVGATGWYRCSIAVSNANEVRYYLAVGNNSPSTAVGDNIYIQDAQLEQGLVATDYIETTTTSVSAGILEDMPRLDYSGGASCPSLLLEPQRTNLVVNSEYANAANWSNGGTTYSNNQATSPEGVVNAIKLIEDNSTAFHYLSSDVTGVITAGTYSISGFIKKGTRKYGGMRAVTNGYVNRYFVLVDLDDGSVVDTNTQGSGVTWSHNVKDYGSGWYRIEISGGHTSGTISSAFSPSDTASPAYFGGLPNYDGSTGEHIFCYGLQYELGSYPTSYIPCMGTSQTRSGDTSITSANTLGGLSVGTFFIEMERQGIDTSETGSAISLRDNAGAEELRLHFDAPASQVRWRDGNNSYAQIGNALPVTAGTAFKIIIKSDGTTAKVFGNGVQLGSDYSIVSAFDFQRIYNYQLGYEIKQQLFFPTALTDSECIALTTI